MYFIVDNRIPTNFENFIKCSMLPIKPNIEIKARPTPCISVEACDMVKRFCCCILNEWIWSIWNFHSTGTSVAIFKYWSWLSMIVTHIYRFIICPFWKWELLWKLFTIFGNSLCHIAFLFVNWTKYGLMQVRVIWQCVTITINTNKQRCTTIKLVFGGRMFIIFPLPKLTSFLT